MNYVKLLRGRNLSPARTNPASPVFDPLRAAAIHANNGNLEEAAWLTFLAVFFGKHRKGGWRYVQDVYGALGRGNNWTWAAVSANPAAFRIWLEQNTPQIRTRGPGGFGNHRKYESLDAAGTATEAYITWVVGQGGHLQMIQNALQQRNGDPKKAFNFLFESMANTGTRLGRLGRFDYLTMLSKLGLAAIEPDSTYLSNSTGPINGAKLLYGNNHRTSRYESWLADFGRALNTGMQELEDALCNWQKSPDTYIRFRS